MTRRRKRSRNRGMSKQSKNIQELAEEGALRLRTRLLSSSCLRTT